MNGKIRRNYTHDELVWLLKWAEHMIADTEKMLRLNARKELHKLIAWELDIYYRAKDLVCRMLDEEEAKQGRGMTNGKKI